MKALPEQQQQQAQAATWIRGPELRKRWGNMPNSTFYDRLKKGLIPKPKYPFGPDTPHWSMSAVLAHEEAAKETA
jgi:predicted DNA-binding transcriptional regulator AlpA